ncbi:hypothetical protein ACTA9V_004895, partial [Escherichia coli]
DDLDSNGKPDIVDRIEKRIYDNNVNQSNRGGTDASANERVEIYDQEMDRSYLAMKNHVSNVGSRLYVQGMYGSNQTIHFEMTESDNIVTTSHSIGNLAISLSSRPQIINTHAGDDTIVAGLDFGFNKGWYSEVNMGSGNDVLIIGMGNSNYKVIFSDDGLRIENKSYVTTGDEIEIDKSSYYKDAGGRIYSSNANMDEGNDTVLVLGSRYNETAIESSKIDLGNGDDVVDVVGNISSDSSIKGGAGFDTLVIHKGNATSNTFSGFEKIELKDSGVLNLLAESLKYDSIEGNKLKITGDGSSRVDLGNNGNTLSDNGHDWIKGGTESEGDITYNIYTHASVPDVQVLIDERITNVV